MAQDGLCTASQKHGKWATDVEQLSQTNKMLKLCLFAQSFQIVTIKNQKHGPKAAHHGKK